MLAAVERYRQEQDMVVVRSVTMVVASLALAGLAGCATRGNLTNATEDLESNANALVRDAGNEIADHAADESRRSDYAAYVSSAHSGRSRPLLAGRLRPLPRTGKRVAFAAGRPDIE
jgi:hypothetical protein